MSKGLEVHISLLSEVASIERLDSQYFLKELVENDNKIESKPYDLISGLGLVTDGNHLTIAENFEQNGIRYLRGQDISSRMMLDERNAVFIPETEYNKLSRSHIFKDDVLITIVGANTGQTALVYNPPSKLTANCKLGFARVNKTVINPAFLHIYLASRFGQKHIQRRIRGGGQTGLILPDLRNLKIPRFDILLETEIAKLNIEAHFKDELSKHVYITAEEQLLEVLKLKNWQPTEEGKAIKKFSRSFAISGRLDAEYYQPMYDEIENKIKSYPFGWKFFGDCISLRDKNFVPKKENEYQYIELSDIGNTGEIVCFTTDLGGNLPGRARRIVKTNDVMLSSIEGSLNKCALVTEPYNNSLCSTGFYVINSNEVSSEVLLLMFKSHPFQDLMKVRCSGTILTAISSDELNTIPIPLLPMDTQKELVKQIQQSFILRQESSKLIDIAKQAVEIAIEQDEQKAINFLTTVHKLG